MAVNQINKNSKENKINYQKQLDDFIQQKCSHGIVPKLLLHCCCAPCSSYVLEYLSRFFEITVFFYNPNIFPEEEYIYRLAEEKRLIAEMPFDNPVKIADCEYQPQDFFDVAKGLEDEPERGARCERCFELRLNKAAEYAKENGFDFFATTLTLSPLKNAVLINEKGKQAQDRWGVEYLPSDFKKKDGYKRSIELSSYYRLYRQNYCGCVFSRTREESSPKNTSDSQSTVL